MYVHNTKTQALSFHDIWRRSRASLNLQTNLASLYYFGSIRGLRTELKLPEDDKFEGHERLRLYSTILRDCASNGFSNEAKAVHGHVIKIGIDPDLHLWNSLVNAYAKCRIFQCAREVLDKMPKRDVVSWTALIMGLVAEGYILDGIGLYCEMRRDGVKPNGHTMVTALRACSMCLELYFGAQLHAEVIKLGVFLDVFVASSLVNLYAKCGVMELAERVFFYAPVKNAVLWNALLHGYVQEGRGEELLTMFSGMKELKLKFSMSTLSTVLKSCEHLENWRGGKVVHAFAVKIGYELDEFFSCCLLDMYSKCGLADDALKVFRRMKEPSTVAWSIMINCLNKSGRSQEAAQIFCLMRYKGIRPNQHTLATIIGTATSLGVQHYCECIHSCIYKYGFDSDNFVCNSLVSMYMKNGYIQSGWRVFKSMSSRNSASWNAVLFGINDNETSEQAPRIFSQMLEEGFKPDNYTFVSILRSCSTLSNVGFGRQVHAHIVKNGLISSTFVGTALIDMYAKSRCLEEADLLFNGLIERDPSTWTVIIIGYAQNYQGEKSVECFREMLRQDFKPNEFTLSSCLSGLSSLKILETGSQLHSLAIKSGLFSNIYVASAVVELYVKYQCIEDAEAVFKGMASRNTVSWNTIICGYSLNGLGKKALEAFRIMLNEGVLPDEVTFIGVLSACSHEGLIEEGKIYFHLLSEYGIIPTIEHCACMVNALSRAGKFIEVETFIEDQKLTQNSLIWETILWACKLHGNIEFGSRAAEKLFELEPEIDYNYVLLSHIFAVRGNWDGFAQVKALMCSRGIKKRPGCSWLEFHDHVHMFFAQDNSHPQIKEINLQLERMAR